MHQFTSHGVHAFLSWREAVQVLKHHPSGTYERTQHWSADDIRTLPIFHFIKGIKINFNIRLLQLLAFNN